MSKFKEWDCIYNNRDISYDVHESKGMNFVASTMNACEESKKNALLISKAPEMLDLLRRMYDLYSMNERVSGSLRDFMIESRKLIKQATEL